MDRLEFGRMQPCFSDSLVSEGAMRSSAVSPVMGHIFSRMMKSVTENDMEAEI
jgi:hypothetical protein